MLALLLLILLPSFAFAEHEGGGSSTGGGHVRVCMTASAAERVKSILVENAISPVTARDALATLSPDEIQDVSLIDLLEQPSVTEQVNAYFKDVGSLVEGNAPSDQSVRPYKLKVLLAGLYQLDGTFADVSQSGFNIKTSPVTQSIKRLEHPEIWHSTTSSIPLTRDFDPKIENPSNCVFAQVARQTINAQGQVRVDYDPRLLAKMSTRDVVALGLHEAVYNAVLKAPRYNALKHPSVTTRELTAQALSCAHSLDDGEERYATALEALGYGPFIDMIRPFHRESTLEFAEDMNQTNGHAPSLGWAKIEGSDREIKAYNEKWEKKLGHKLREIRLNHYESDTKTDR